MRAGDVEHTAESVTPITILAVDDDVTSLRVLTGCLTHFGYTVVPVFGGAEALAELGKRSFDLVISDLSMPVMDGITLLEEMRRHSFTIPFIIVTACGSIESAVSAMRMGASDYIEKPFNVDALNLIVQRAIQHYRAISENSAVRAYLQDRYTFQNIITACPAMMETLQIASKVVNSPRTSVAIYGESGTGKEVLARAIHFASHGLPGNFVAVNCAAIPEALLESELFGHVRGAFTGADKEREGKFSLAQGGTLFLDEIGDMPAFLQAKLLRVLEERSFEKVGSNQTISADFRVIVATHRNLAEMVQRGEFREDLFHRINVVPLYIPPLRERREDIPLLIEHFLDQFRKHQGKSLPGISKKALDQLVSYRWPGNIRELRNMLEYAAIMVSDELIRPDHLRMPSSAESGAVSHDGDISISLAGDISLEEITSRVLELTLQRCGGNKSQAAALLKVDRKRFYR
jgi:DNA-binding NtrC family response regulator